MAYFYREFVDNENIKYKGEEHNNLRYLLEIPLRNYTNKSILVIMKNPSLANELKSDHTINNVLKYCNSKQYSKIYIMNLYAYYSTNPDGVAKLIKNNQDMLAIGRENDEILKEIITKVDDVVVAWGSNTFACTTKYKERIKQVSYILKGKNLFYVEKLSKCGWYPKHAQVWSVNKEIDMFNWTPPFNHLN